MGERVHLTPVLDRVRPVVLSREQTLPVLPPLAGLFPDGALPRGITASVAGPGAASLALSLVAAPTRAGSWAAFVGLAGTGLAAAAELGVALERVVVITPPEPSAWPAVAAALIGAFDLIVVGLRHRVPAGAARRLVARARERGSVLVFVPSPLGAGGTGAWPEATDLRLVTSQAEWHGLADGHGHLQWRRLQVEATGRRSLARPRRIDLLLPGPTGGVEIATTTEVPTGITETGIVEPDHIRQVG